MTIADDSDYGQWSFFPVLGITSDVPDLWSFADNAPQGPSLLSDESPDPPDPQGPADVGES